MRRRAEDTLQKKSFFGRREVCLDTGAVAEGETGDGVRETQDDDGKDPPRKKRRKRDDGVVAKHDDE